MPTARPSGAQAHAASIPVPAVLLEDVARTPTTLERTTATVNRLESDDTTHPSVSPRAANVVVHDEPSTAAETISPGPDRPVEAGVVASTPERAAPPADRPYDDAIASPAASAAIEIAASSAVHAMSRPSAYEVSDSRPLLQGPPVATLHNLSANAEEQPRTADAAHPDAPLVAEPVPPAGAVGDAAIADADAAADATAAPVTEPSASGPGSRPIRRDEIMEEIRDGVALRPVPRANLASRPIAADLATEIHWRHRALGQRKEAAYEQALRQHDRALDAFGRDFSSSIANAVRLETAVALLDRADLLLRTVDVPLDTLVRHRRWPDRELAELRAAVAALKPIAEACESVSATLESVRSAAKPADSDGAAIDYQLVDGAVLEQQLHLLEHHQAELRKGNILLLARQYIASTDAYQDQLRHLSVEVLQLLVEKAAAEFSAVNETVADGRRTVYDRNWRLRKAYHLLRTSQSAATNLLPLAGNERDRAAAAQVASRAASLATEIKATAGFVVVGEREGAWDAPQTVSLQRAAADGSHEPVTPGNLKHRALEIVADNGANGVGQLQQLALQFPQQFTAYTSLLGLAAIEQSRLVSLQALCDICRSDKPIVQHWMERAVTKGNAAAVSLLCNCGADVNARTSDAGNTVLHLAARRNDAGLMAHLVKLGANPRLANAAGKTPLQLLAQHRPCPAGPSSSEPRGLGGFDAFLNSDVFSDITLVAGDGQRFYAHRLLLAARSPFFESLLRTGASWRESQMADVTLPCIPAHALHTVFTYLYTGECLVSQDSLAAALDVLAAADYLQLDHLHEAYQVPLCRRIDHDSCFPLHERAKQLRAGLLKAHCLRFVLQHYDQLQDPDHAQLISLLENAALCAAPGADTVTASRPVP